MAMRSSLVACALIASVISTAALAQDANAQKALQKAQFMLRQAASEKAALQSELDAARRQLEEQARELAATKSSATQAQQKTEEKYTGAIAQWKQRDGEQSAELATTKEQLKQQLAQRAELEAKLQRESGNFSACYENNRKLYELNRELLARYESKGFGDVLSQREPFTGMKQVEIENLLQDYRYRLDELQMKPTE